jgi:hypothetical protein
MNLTRDQLFELAQTALVRMDGAWFIAVANQFGKDAAWETDVAAWSQLSYVLGKTCGGEFRRNRDGRKIFLMFLRLSSQS